MNISMGAIVFSLVTRGCGGAEVSDEHRGEQAARGSAPHTLRAFLSCKESDASTSCGQI